MPSNKPKPQRHEHVAQEQPFTVAQAADWLQCSEVSIRRWIARGDLRAFRYGRTIRIEPADLRKMRRPVTPVAGLLDCVGGDAA